MSQDMDSLKKAFQCGSDYKPYISSIVFPKYKNLSPSSELTLDFPLTLLIGRNGTNKSSILHALYGCPRGKSTGEYWFSTYTDPISDNSRAAYFYRYTDVQTGDTAEVLKTRINRKGDPDYWEPSRPVLEYGMKPFPTLENKNHPIRSMTRWNAINKEVLYLDFRAEISAFDKAFYKAVKNRLAHRKALRKYSRPLKEAIKEKLQSKKYYRKERISVNHLFTQAQRSIVNKILGSDYKEIIYIEHDFYFSGSFSVYIKKGHENNYSEAFAGSGETSIMRLIYAIDRSPEKALILLDEPETSLHIDAQYKLREFILEKIKEKKLQVVISTHSPFFARGLPDCAIKVLIRDEDTERIKLFNSSPADESSFYLGYKRPESNKSLIFVEDKLAQALLRFVLNKRLSESQRDKITVDFIPGGVNTMLDMAATEMLKDRSNASFVFDGDQMPNGGIRNPEEVPPSDNDRLKDILQCTFKYCPRIPMDSNNQEQKFDLYRKYLSFARKHFRYLPCQTSEEFIVANHKEFTDQNSSDPKEVLKDYAERKLSDSGEINSDAIFYLQRTLLSDIPENNEVFDQISEILVELSDYAS